MHTLHETFWGRTNRVAGEEEGHRAAKSNGVMEGDGQRPLHTAMGAEGTMRRRRSRKEADTPKGRREQQLRRRCFYFKVLVHTAARMWPRDHALSCDGRHERIQQQQCEGREAPRCLEITPKSRTAYIRNRGGWRRGDGLFAACARQDNAARWHVTSCCRVRALLIDKNTVRWSGDVQAEVLETASVGTGCSTNRADNVRESKVIARAANAADGARHILYNADRAKIQESAEYDGI